MTIVSEDDVRGGVYLCQVGGSVSCGGCCGLYNIRDLQRERLRTTLAKRTAEFAHIPRNVAAILAFAQDRMSAEGSDHPLLDLHHCVFVGLIQDGGERVGCLLHPLATGNRGVDWRGLSFYGGAACKYFFCPTYDHLQPRWKHVVRAVIDDWYAYGLIIPEHRFISAVLGAVEERLGRPLDLRTMPTESKSAIARLLTFRIDWPFRKENTHAAWNFFSTKDTDRPERLGDVRHPHLLLRQALRELDTAPENAKTGALLLEEMIHSCVQSINPPT